METLRTIRLYGKLGSQFGRVHRLAVESTAEAVRALCTLLPGFQRELMTSRERGVGYACFLGKQNIGLEELTLSGGNADIRIAPIVTGAKSGGVFTFIAGAALVAIGAAINILSDGALSWIGTPMMHLGSAMMLGGIIQILSPQQMGASKAQQDNGASYNFTGAVNTTIQGSSVPLLYGRMTVGSAVISAGILAEDQAYVGAPLAQPSIPSVPNKYHYIP